MLEMELLKKNKKAMVAALAACAIVGTTGIGALVTSNTSIANNSFTKDAAQTFTFTGNAFDAHYNATSKTASEDWTAANAGTATVHYDGIFTVPTGDLPLAFAKQLNITYTLTPANKGFKPFKASGGTLADPISLANALKDHGGVPIAAGASQLVGVTLTWTGTDPAPSQAITALSDFNVTYN